MKDAPSCMHKTHSILDYLDADSRTIWKSTSRQSQLILVIVVSNLIFLEGMVMNEKIWIRYGFSWDDSCRHGYKCRFLKAHMDADGNLIKNEEVRITRSDDNRIGS